jgi:hypothetical protein
VDGSRDVFPHGFQRSVRCSFVQDEWLAEQFDRGEWCIGIVERRGARDEQRADDEAENARGRDARSAAIARRTQIQAKNLHGSPAERVRPKYLNTR